jgi:hypothetical protein
MKKVKFFYMYPINVDITTEKDVEVHIDQCSSEPVPEGTIRIVIMEEPKKGPLFNKMLERPDLCTHLLTFHEELLAANEKARLFHCMNLWVSHSSKQKKFSVSTVVGGKKDPVMLGYAMRHALWHRRDDITTSKAFYLSGSTKYPHIFVPYKNADYETNLVLGASKEPLFDSMFHIAIENTAIKNYFSEKLLDCFQARTVPIYYGCPNIGEYFNIDGILIANSVQEIIDISNNLTEDMYHSMKPAMEDNYNILQKKWRIGATEKWCSHHDAQIEKEIRRII